jgi:hypothetical protein
MHIVVIHIVCLSSFSLLATSLRAATPSKKGITQQKHLKPYAPPHPLQQKIGVIPIYGLVNPFHSNNVAPQGQHDDAARDHGADRRASPGHEAPGAPFGRGA